MVKPYRSGSFRAGRHLLVVVGLFTLFFLGLTLAVFLKTGTWGPLLVVLVVLAGLWGLLGSLRLDISPSGFATHGWLGSRHFAFAQIRGACIDVEYGTKAPQGVAVFRVQPRQGPSVKVGVRVFPVEAAVLLLTALEAHGIALDVPDEWAARRMHQQIRDAQARPSARAVR